MTHDCAELYDPSYNIVRRIVRYHTMHHRIELYDHHTIPYDPPYDTLYGTVRRTIVWNHTILYDASYATVRRVVRHRTSRRTLPYDAPYGPS